MRNRIITTDSHVGVVSNIIHTKIQYHDHSVIHRTDNKILNIAHLAENWGPGCAVFRKDACLEIISFWCD
jgi:hypothetical protein